MRRALRSRWQDLQTSLWFVPGLIALAFALLAAGVLELDRALDTSGEPFLFGGDASAARSVVSTVAGSLITVAGLTFSVTIVVLQLASSQYSPRVLRSFLGDRVTQVTAGTFVGLFVYCLLVLRVVRGGEDAFVPALGITTSILLAVGSLALLLVFISHLASLVQVDNIAARIYDSLLAGGKPLAGQERRRSEHDLVRWRREYAALPVYPERPGFVQSIALDELVHESPDDEWRLELRARPGDFVARDEPLALVYGDGELADDCRRRVVQAFTVANERDVAQDQRFPVRQLADMALKAVSPAVNDPTTAVTCVAYMRSALVYLADREPQGMVLELCEGRVVVALRPLTLVDETEPLLQLGQHCDRVPAVGTAVLEALTAVFQAAARHRRGEAEELGERTEPLARHLLDAAGSQNERVHLRRAAGSFFDAAGKAHG